MSDLAFFDTNILIYTDDDRSPAKRARAAGLIEDYQRRDAVAISLQVLQEYYAVITRKLGIDAEQAQRKVEILAQEKVIRFDSRDVIAAIELHRLTRISFWDAMIVHAARLANASVLYTEDLPHGTVLGGVPVVNPFLKA
jgi:predicted nucleic acid-binding protein